ncbi:hypothetical protein HmCmsJML195_03575 [Escherichia coli]|nr:hypothetical protein HmCmsJML195_03575 [Escherichia coli]
MSIAWHYSINIILSFVNYYFLQVSNIFLNFTDNCSHMHFRINSGLIITTSRRVEFTTNRANNFSHPSFNCHMNIFIYSIENELAVFNFFTYLSQTTNNCIGFILCDYSLTS